MYEVLYNQKVCNVVIKNTITNEVLIKKYNKRYVMITYWNVRAFVMFFL